MTTVTTTTTMAKESMKTLVGMAVSVVWDEACWFPVRRQLEKLLSVLPTRAGAAAPSLQRLRSNILKHLPKDWGGKQQQTNTNAMLARG